MKKKELPLHLYKEPTILTENGKSIITFEYFNVKKYRYEVFKVNRTFSTGDTTEIETQRKKVYKALKRDFAPDIDLIEGEFKTHTMEMKDIDKVTYLSTFYLVLCELHGWQGFRGIHSPGPYLGIITGFEFAQLSGIISLLTKNRQIAEDGFGIAILLSFAVGLFFDLFYTNRTEKKYYSHYVKLSPHFRDYIGHVLITIIIEAVAVTTYFFFKL